MSGVIIFDLDDTLIQTGMLRGRRELHDLTLAPGALEILSHTRGRNVLVTAGDRVWQEQKIDFVGLRLYFNEMVIVPTPVEKEAQIRVLVSKYKTPDTTIVVIGDRCDLEIRAGNLLGCYTVRIALPEGNYTRYVPKCEEEYPHFCARDLFEALAHLEEEGLL